MFKTAGKCIGVKLVDFDRIVAGYNTKDKNTALYENAYYRIIINFEYNSLILTAVGECCSTSWFEEYEQPLCTALTGKEIVGIKSENEDDIVEMPHSRVQECDRNHICAVIVKLPDETAAATTNINFLLRNSSNGYYGGYINIKWEYGAHVDTPIPITAHLVVVIGLPGSGKTTYIHRNYKIVKNTESAQKEDECYFYDDYLYLSEYGHNGMKVMRHLAEGKRVIIADPRFCNTATFRKEVMKTFTRGLPFDQPARQKHLLDHLSQVTIIAFTPDPYQSVLNVMKRANANEKKTVSERKRSAMKFIKSISNLEDGYSKWYRDLASEYSAYWEFHKKIRVDTYGAAEMDSMAT